MENTIENKAKLFAQYWGQNVIEDVNNKGEKIIYPATGSNMYRFDESILLLKSLSSITDEDAEVIANMNISLNSKGFFVFTSKNGAIKFGKNNIYFLIDKTKTADYLRSKGYALPYLGLSVEKQIEYGWIKLSTNEA